jgi:hypothetical protein
MATTTLAIPPTTICQGCHEPIGTPSARPWSCGDGWVHPTHYCYAQATMRHAGAADSPGQSRRQGMDSHDTKRLWAGEIGTPQTKQTSKL